MAEYENLGKTEVVNIEFTTLAKAVPGILLVNPTSTKTSIGFTVDETDADNVGAITKIELVHKDGTVVADSIEQRAFTNLLSNNSYTVKVTYVYNLNDGLGDKTTTQALKVSTASKRIPTFSSITNKKVGLSSFSADYELNDVDNTLTYYKVELYEGSTLVTENPDKKISFTELSYYTDYTVKITYGYDLNDGKGELTKSRDYSFKTQPYINVTEFKILNSTAVSVGDTILISAKLDNPFGLTVKSVEINGKKYDVTGASTTNRIYVEIVHNGQFAGGDTYFSIENLNATLDSAWFTVAPESRLSDNVFINGKLEIVKMELVNEKLEPVEWTFPSDKVYVLITLDNPTGYTLYALDCINAVTEVKKIDDNRWCCQVELDDGWNEVHLNWIGYRNEYIENGALDCSGLNDYCYKVTSDEIKYVTTPDDLKNMNGGCYYELVGDIDLSGLEWVGNDFNGVFNGKGYAIKNMSFVGTFKNEEARLGLFSAGSGFIQNLNVEKASIIAEITSDNVNGYYAYCGGLVASAIQLNIYNCNIDEYSVFTVKNTTNQDTYVGGLIGYVENNTTVNIQSSVNSADISADNYVGGFVGYVEFDTIVTITNCENRGSVVGSYCAGGFVGYASTVSIADCTNSGDVSAEGEMTTYAGGFVGCASALSIADCTNSGVIGAVSEYSSYAGGFVGYTSTVTIANCTNSGDVSACGGGTAYAGGFVGSASSDYAAFTIENCTNSGDVSAEGEMTAYAGGFVGSAEDVSIENCTNSGDVSTAGEKNIIAGGFVGSAADVSIADCTNRGNIMAQSKSEFESMDTLSLGGFVGIARHLRVSWCINRGNVSADVGRRSSALGGFVGDVTHDSQIDGCVNYGSLSGGYYVGGFVGRIRGGYNSSVKMSYCLNSVNLGSDFVFGGLIGKNDTSNLDVENSYSLANGRGYNGELCTIEQLNSKEFYTDRLCWSVEDWDFSDLDVENGKYPKQK